MIAHIMSPQMKNFYKLEKRWVGAEVSCVVNDNKLSIFSK